MINPIHNTFDGNNVLVCVYAREGTALVMYRVLLITLNQDKHWTKSYESFILLVVVFLTLRYLIKQSRIRAFCRILWQNDLQPGVHIGGGGEWKYRIPTLQKIGTSENVLFCRAVVITRRHKAIPHFRPPPPPPYIRMCCNKNTIPCHISMFAMTHIISEYSVPLIQVH